MQCSNAMQEARSRSTIKKQEARRQQCKTAMQCKKHDQEARSKKQEDSNAMQCKKQEARSKKQEARRQQCKKQEARSTIQKSPVIEKNDMELSPCLTHRNLILYLAYHVKKRVVKKKI